MSAFSLMAFAIVFGIACASPGPAVAAVVARVVGKGTVGIPAFCAGLVLGDLVWLGCAAFGLAALATLFQPIFAMFKYLGAAYLLFLAWKLWTAPAEATIEARGMTGDGLRLFLGGLALTLGNPKTMLFYLAILPTVVALAELTWLGFVELAAVVVFVYGLVLSGYVLLAARMRRIVRNGRTMRIVNRVTGAMMASAAVAVASRP